MNKIVRLLVMPAILMLIGLGTAWATIPAGYYSSLSGKSGQALKNAIHDLAMKHTVLSYSSLWNYFQTTDCRIDNQEVVWDMYSNHTYYFRGSSAAYGMNKEHSLPKSWWGGYTDPSSYPSYTDINHLYPADADANSAKLHWPLGEVSSASYDNGVTRVGSPMTGQGGGASSVFEPADEYKGDFARTYFYMACCYQHYTWKYTFMMSNTSWQTLNEWSMAMLCRWARADAVSDKEVARNDAVQQCQNNRNPFIDFPDLFEYIWGDKQGQVFNLNEAGTSSDTTTYDGSPELIAPTQGTVLDFGTVALGKSLDYTVYIKGRNLNNTLSIMLYKYDSEMFSIPVTSLSRVTANSEMGYPLKITYKPTQVGEHTARLLIYDGGLEGSVGVELRAKCVLAPTRINEPFDVNAIVVDASSYEVMWDADVDTEEQVDYYRVTRTIYNPDDGTWREDQWTTDDASHTSLAFTDRLPGQTHTLYVQACRLGYESEPSRTITIDATGLTGPDADKPLHVLSGNGYIVIKCSEPLGKARIYNIAGQLVTEVDELENDQIIYLSQGIYLLTTATSRQSIKVVVK